MMLSFLLLGSALCAAFVVVAAWSRHKKGAGRVPDLTGRVGSVAVALRPEGAVLVAGELWRARVRSGGNVERGRVRVVGARGHLLEVEAES